MSHRFRLFLKNRILGPIFISMQKNKEKVWSVVIIEWPSDLDLFGIIVTLGTLQKDSY